MNTTYFLNQVMGNVFGTKKSPALPTKFYLGLSSTTPTVEGTGVTEPLSSANYERVEIDVLSEPTNGVITNTDSISFDESTANWGRMTHFVIFDAQEGGNLLIFDALSTPRNVEAATIVTIKKDSLTLSLVNPS